MARRKGVLSHLKNNVRRGKGGLLTLTYTKIILNDPCVYCGEYGCDSLDHITPVAKATELSTGYGKNHYTNLAPCHRDCNRRKGIKGVLYGLMGKLPVNETHLDNLT